MKSIPKRFPSSFILVCFISLSGILTTSCKPVNPSPVIITENPPVQSQSSPDTPVPTATIARTPPALPEVYQSSLLNPLDTPHTYINDTCGYLRDKWSSLNSPPGTVVMIVMLNSIKKGIPQGGDIVNVTSFTRMMTDLHDQQFQAINTAQLAGFLENNAKISARSVVIIQDGRRYADNFNKHFLPYWETWGWPVVNAWDPQADSTDALWNENVALENEGWVDHQVFGLSMDPNTMDNLTDSYFKDELQKEITTFQQHFNKPPIAIVWPRAFAARPVQIARQLGYQLGFTANARGPVMFNWVPLAEKTDTMRPSYPPEGAAGDPLMTLPRYTPFQVHDALDTIRVIGKAAAAYADQNKAAEMDYYDIECAPANGPIP
jgi:hypothetical protein